MTTCRSLVPVALEMLRGRMRTSKMCGVCSHGMRKCVPSPFTPLCERGVERRASSVKRRACMWVISYSLASLLWEARGGAAHLHATETVEHHRTEAAIHIVDGGLEERDAGAKSNGGLGKVVEGIRCHGCTTAQVQERVSGRFSELSRAGWPPTLAALDVARLHPKKIASQT